MAKTTNTQMNNAVRKVTCVLLILTILVCLLTVCLNLTGVQPFFVKNESRSVSESIQYFEKSGANYNSLSWTNSTVIYTNNYQALHSLLQKSPREIVNDEASILDIAAMILTASNTVFYVMLAVWMAVTMILLGKKLRAAKAFVLISGIVGTVVILLGFLIGWFLMKHYQEYVMYTYRALPQQSILLALPLFMQMPLLALSLNPKKKPAAEE